MLPHIVEPYDEHLPDYEVELVIVIGKTAKNVPEEEALDYVLGYTGANDVGTRSISCSLNLLMLLRSHSGNGSTRFHRWDSPKVSTTQIRSAQSSFLQQPSLILKLFH